MRRSLTTQFVDRVAYVAVRVAICVIQSLPRSFCERFARGASNLLANRVKIRRQVVRENLQQAFPEWTPEQAREAARGMWVHLLVMVVEIAHSERVIRKTTWRRHLRIHGMERFLRELWADRPKVILSGHYGNFEMSAFVFGLFGFRIYSVARELDNPLLDRFVTKFREARGQIILPKKGSAPDVALVLENNGVIGLLGDPPATGLVSEAVVETPYVVVAQQGHPLLRKRKVTLDDLGQYDWVTGTPGSNRHQRFERLFADRKKPQARVETSSLATITHLLARGDRLTLLTSYELKYATSALKALAFGPLHPAPAVGLITREGWMPTPLQADFMELFRGRVQRALEWTPTFKQVG